jgi:hypothetical protein
LGEEATTAIASLVSKLGQDTVENSLMEENLTGFSCFSIECESLKKCAVWIVTIASSDCAMIEIRPLRHSPAQASLNRNTTVKVDKFHWIWLWLHLPAGVQIEGIVLRFLIAI